MDLDEGEIFAEKIRSCLVHLTKYSTNFPATILSLLETAVIQSEEYDTLKAYTTEHDRNSELYRLMIKKCSSNPKNCQKLLDTLKKTDSGAYDKLSSPQNSSLQHQSSSPSTSQANKGAASPKAVVAPPARKASNVIPASPTKVSQDITWQDLFLEKYQVPVEDKSLWSKTADTKEGIFTYDNGVTCIKVDTKKRLLILRNVEKFDLASLVQYEKDRSSPPLQLEFSQLESIDKQNFIKNDRIQCFIGVSSKQLQHLRLKLNNPDIPIAIYKFENLISVALDNVKIIATSELTQKNPKLKIMSLRNCQLNEQAFQYFSDFFPGLMTLFMENCQQVTNKQPLPDQDFLKTCLQIKGIEHIWIDNFPVDAVSTKYLTTQFPGIPSNRTKASRIHLQCVNNKWKGELVVKPWDKQKKTLNTLPGQ